MPRTTKSDTGRPIESYEHKDKERLNNPPVGLVTPDTDPDAGPRLTRTTRTWTRNCSGPARRSTPRSKSPRSRCTSTSALTRAPSSKRCAARQTRPPPCNCRCSRPASENPPLREAIEFYQHAHGWSNRLVAGD